MNLQPRILYPAKMSSVAVDSRHLTDRTFTSHGPPSQEVTRRCTSPKKGVWDPGNKSNIRKKQRDSKMRYYSQPYTSPKGQPVLIGAGAH